MARLRLKRLNELEGLDSRCPNPWENFHLQNLTLRTTLVLSNDLVEFLVEIIAVV